MEKISGYTSYLGSLHSNFGVPYDVLSSYTKEVLDAVIVDGKRVNEGVSNEVYDLHLSNGSEIIIRIGRSQKGNFGRENWAISNCL